MADPKEKAPVIVDAEELAKTIIADAKAEAKKAIEVAEGRAKDLILKAKKETEAIDGISKIRKELIGKLCHSAGQFDAIPSAIAKKILATADAIIDSLKEGK